MRPALLAVPFLLTLCAGLPAQDPQTPTELPQQQQNELRAAAFSAQRDGRFSEAADAFLELSKHAPDRADWVLAAGRCLGRSGRLGEAVDLLDAARKRLPQLVEVRALLARTLLLRAESEPMPHPEVLWADAAELAEGVLDTQPDHEDSRLLLAQARYLQGDWDEAVRQAEEAVKRFPQRAGAHVLLGRIARDRFEDELRRFRADQPTGQERADRVAAIDAQRKLARREFERAAEIDPSRAHPHVALSQLASIDGKHDAAREHLLDALALDPQTPTDHDRLTEGMTWQQRRDLYVDLQKRYAAATAAGTVPDEANKRATLCFHQGRAELEGQSWQAAHASFLRALALDPTATNGHYYAFLAAYYLDRFDEAEQQAAEYARHGAAAFADVLRSLPVEQRAQISAMVQFLGDRAYGAKRIENSRDLNHVIACLKDSADAWNNHAFLCRETGRFDDALKSYVYAIDREPGSPQLWNDAGVILQYHLASEENLQRARTMYDKALELADKVLADPDSSERARTFAAEAKQNAKLNLAELAKK